MSAMQMQLRASEPCFNPYASMVLDHDCTVRVLLAAGTLPGGSSFSLWEFCRLQCVNRTFRHAALEVLASITTLQPRSLGKLTQGWTVGGAPQVPCKRLGLAATLQRCTALLSIDLSGLYLAASNQMLKDIAASCPQLRQCRLSRCICLTTEGLEALVDGLPGLRSLSLLGCNDLGGALAVGRLRQLEKLELSWCQYVDARALSGSCGALRKLYLRGCHAVCDNVCRQLPSVEELDLAFTSVTDQGLTELVRASPRLRKLTLAQAGFNVWQTGLWTDDGLAAFREAAPHVEIALVAC